MVIQGTSEAACGAWVPSPHFSQGREPPELETP